MSALRAVFKYPLEITDGEQHIKMPIAARVLGAQMQRGRLCLWALVWPDSAREARRFRVVGTGHALQDEPLSYVGTVQTHDGVLVWHVFEVHSE